MAKLQGSPPRQAPLKVLAGHVPSDFFFFRLQVPLSYISHCPILCSREDLFCLFLCCIINVPKFYNLKQKILSSYDFVGMKFGLVADRSVFFFFASYIVG